MKPYPLNTLVHILCQSPFTHFIYTSGVGDGTVLVEFSEEVIEFELSVIVEDKFVPEA